MRYTAKRWNVNKEKANVLALLKTHIRALEAFFGYDDARTKTLRFVTSEIERNAHRGDP